MLMPIPLEALEYLQPILLLLLIKDCLNLLQLAIYHLILIAPKLKRLHEPISVPSKRHRKPPYSFP